MGQPADVPELSENLAALGVDRIGDLAPALGLLIGIQAGGVKVATTFVRDGQALGNDQPCRCTLGVIQRSQIAGTRLANCRPDRSKGVNSLLMMGLSIGGAAPIQGRCCKCSGRNGSGLSLPGLPAWEPCGLPWRSWRSSPRSWSRCGAALPPAREFHRCAVAPRSSPRRSPG